MEHWISPHPDKMTARHPLFLCVLSNTDTARVPGVSAAGKSPGVIDYTPACDAELVTYGRTISRGEPPMTGISPTPAVITRAAMLMTGIPFMFIKSGLNVVPQIPLLDVGGRAGLSITTGRAVQDAVLIFEHSVELGRQLKQLSDLVIIGESVPGGTTTAMCVLAALGVNGKVSSSFSNNPLNIKEKLVHEAFKSSGVCRGELAGNPMRAMECFGDPMMPCVCGLVKGLGGTDIVLAGGTQMMAVLAILKLMGIKGSISIATTRFVAEDPTASFSETVSAFDVDSYIADPGFNYSRNPGLRMYESGVVKEGVGAGGAMLAAGLMGFGQKEFRAQVENVCDQIFGGH